MKPYSIVLLVATLHCSLKSFSQNDLNIFHFTSSHTSFPDAARDSGHTYKSILYDRATHYGDSSVMLVAPKKLKVASTIDLVFWFHGWGNNIDSAALRYKLLSQFSTSQLNAVLVFAETARNAPDSYGGKLEQENTFKELVNDIVTKLKKEKLLTAKGIAGNFILAGHSGAYRVMANILQKGNLPVQEVILFDALYAETEKFINWLKADKQNRFIDIYTNGGGTDGESKEMIKKLSAANITADTSEEKDVTIQELKAMPVIFIHSLHEHNDIINDPDNFKFFLEASPFLRKTSR